MMKKSFLVIITVLIMSVACSGVAFAASTSTQKKQDDKSKAMQKAPAKDAIKVLLNDTGLKLKNQPYMKGDKLLVPLREVLENVDKGLEWEGNEQVVYAKLTSGDIYIKVGVDYGYLNGYRTQLELAPEMRGNVLYAPLSLAMDGLGAEGKWDSKLKAANIRYIDAVYKLGERGAYNKTKFSIDSVDSSALGVLKVMGSINSKAETVMIEASDDNGYVVAQTMVIGQKKGDAYSMSGSLSLPTCHNFQAKQITVKIINKDKKAVKVGRYAL